MTVNYNDGKWHGWNGGECPVHMRSEVRVLWCSDDREEVRCGMAGNIAWLGNEYGNVVAFRVIKEHKEPREFWLCVWNICTKKEAAEKIRNEKHDGIMEIIHIREVIA